LFGLDTTSLFQSDRRSSARRPLLAAGW
jgi:hypothetical protein